MVYEKRRAIAGFSPVSVTWALLGAAALGSCKGDGVIDPHYPGTELALIRGQISATTPPAADSVSLGIVWVSAKLRDANLGPGGFGGGDPGGNVSGGGGGGGNAPGEGSLGGTSVGAGGEAGSGLGGFGGDGFVGSDQLGSGGSAGAFPGTGGSSGDPHTVATVRPRNSPGPNGSLLDPPLLGCDGSPAAVAVDDLYGLNATPIARTASYKTTFPVSFTIPITTLPPDDALVPFDVPDRGRGRFAIAHLVAFIDDNHNDRLDLPSADGIPDRILALSTQEIVYVDDVVPPADANGQIPGGWLPLPHGIPQGFSIVEISPNDQLAIVETLQTVLPASTPLNLTLPESQIDRDNATSRVCGTFEERIEHFQPTQAAPNDAFIIPGGDDFGSGVAWHYYPHSENPCYQLAFFGHICK